MAVSDASAKARLRAVLREQLAAIAEQERVLASAAACEHLCAAPELSDAASVFVFVGVGHEIDTRPLLARLLRDGRRVCVPFLGPGPEPMRQRVMRAVAIDAVEDCRPAAFGLLEPVSDERAVDPATLDCVVAPGLAFDRHGARLGQGGGFYDRFLRPWRAAREDGSVIGYGFRQQLVDAVPVEEHDVRVDAFVSDAGRLRCVG